MIGVYNPSVIMTYFGACLSVFGMFLCGQGQVKYACKCLIFSGICDLFDGVIARKCKRTQDEKAFGVQIDSLTDMISFIAFPVVIGYTLMSQLMIDLLSVDVMNVNALPTNQWMNIVIVVVLMIYTLCGIIRLAWYNVHTGKEERVRYFDGLPVTYVALILPVFYLFRGLISPSVYLWLIVAVYLIVSGLFVWKVKIRKPFGVWYGVFGLLSIVVTILISNSPV